MSINYFKAKCPKCGADIKIIRNTDWDNLVTMFYPFCELCGWTTKEQYQSEEYLISALSDYTLQD